MRTLLGGAAVFKRPGRPPPGRDKAGCMDVPIERKGVSILSGLVEMVPRAGRSGKQRALEHASQSTRASPAPKLSRLI